VEATTAATAMESATAAVSAAPALSEGKVRHKEEKS
jgi:hypothetical protein